MSWLISYFKRRGGTEEDNVFGDASLWKPGQLVLLDNVGVNGFAVSEVLEWDEAVSADEDFSAPDKDTIHSYNPFGSMTYRRGESVPLQYLKYYGDPHYPSYDKGVHLVGPQNVYATLGDLLKKSLRTVFPDMLLSIYTRPYIQEFAKDFPRLVGESPFKLIEYETYHIRGYEVSVMKDPRRMRKPVEYEQNQFYWAIPELNVRSLYMGGKIHDIKKQDLKKLWWEVFGQGGHHRTAEEAAANAEKFINYFVFMEESSTV